MRFFARISFNGRNYHGWQVQENAHSVQAELNNALSVVLNRKDVETIGCGRTDTGVHATKFFAHFEADEISDADKVMFKLNSVLPHDIAVHSIFPVGETDHARFSAVSRTYVYRIYESKNPF